MDLDEEVKEENEKAEEKVETSSSLNYHLEPLEQRDDNPISEMAVNINNMKENYLKDDEIAKELENINLENFLDFDNNGSYEFVIVGLAMDHC